MKDSQDVLVILAEPFVQYGELSISELRAATYAARGHNPKEIASALGVSLRTTYRHLDSAAAKVSKQDGRQITKHDFTKHLMKQLREALNK